MRASEKKRGETGEAREFHGLALFNGLACKHLKKKRLQLKLQQGKLQQKHLVLGSCSRGTAAYPSWITGGLGVGSGRADGRSLRRWRAAPRSGLTFRCGKTRT